METMLEGLARLDKRHTCDLAGVLARAFHDDPMFAYLFPDEEGRRKTLPVTFGAIAAMAIARGEAYAPSGALEGCILVSGPGRAHFSPAVLAAAARGLALPFRVAARTGMGGLFRRAWSMRRAVVEMRACKQALGKCLSIDMIAVDEPYRGKGLMSAMMRAALAEAAGAGVKCVLDTESERNVGIYRHFGFSLVRTIDVVPGRLAIHVMACDPKAVS